MERVGWRGRGGAVKQVGAVTKVCVMGGWGTVGWGGVACHSPTDRSPRVEKTNGSAGSVAGGTAKNF